MSGAGGLFLTVEGIEGVGKSTQIELLAARIRAGGRETVPTREPGGTSLGERLRAVLLERDGPAIAPEVELLLYAADRAQHIVERIRPALDRGAVVLCDRYLDATLAYQGYGRGLGVEAVRRLHVHPPLDLRPDRTILLDLDARTALARARRRNDDRRMAADEGRFEEEALAFHLRVRRGYLELAEAEPDRFRVVPADGSAADVQRRVLASVGDLLSGPSEIRTG